MGMAGVLLSVRVWGGWWCWVRCFLLLGLLDGCWEGWIGRGRRRRRRGPTRSPGIGEGRDGGKGTMVLLVLVLVGLPVLPSSIHPPHIVFFVVVVVVASVIVRTRASPAPSI